jgi:tetratricopeptide (TPR) repeat protein
MNRLRSLFPYMAAHEQWSAIAACDNPDVPYVTFAQALVSVYARIQTRDMAGAALALRQGLRQWPDDIRFLDSLFMLASLKPGGEWEGRFAATFRANLRGMDADMLASYINYCFRLARPDLAWMAYRRLQVVSPDDPALLLAPAQYGSEWFSIRRVSAGIVGRDQGSEADLRAAISQSCGIRPFAAAWKTIPLLDTILTVAPESIRREYVKKCLSELEKREARGELPIRMEMMFAVALAMDDRFQEAHDRLTSVEKRHPELRMDVLFQHLVLYDQEARWQDAYETGRICRAEGKLPNLTTDLLFVNAMMNLDLGMPAMAVLRAAAQDFPGVSSIVVAEAAIWDVFGYKEQALHVLSSAGGDTDNRMFPQLLYDTGRIREAEQKAGALGLQIRTSPPPRQMLAPEPAENVFLKKLPPPLTDAEMDQEAAKARQWLSASGSPFLERLTRLMLAYYASRGAEPSRRVEEWENGFRDDMEAGTALYRLALLCGRQGDMDTALRAVRASLGRAPDSAILWRIRLAFGDSGADVIGQAAKACPDDPEIWLASVVAGIRDKRGEEWAESVMRSAAASKRYSPGAMVRAGDFLFRCNMTGAAAIAARAAADRGAGLLSAQVLGYKCAMASKDWDWALSCALRGIEQAVDPAPFYKAVVVVKSVKKNPDADFVAALEYLRGQFPDEFKWSEQLALVYFQKGDMQRSLSILSPLIGGRLKGVRIQSVLVASEAARMEGEHIKAVGILETAHAVYPEKASILNNLVYNLAQDKATVSRAMELLPALVQMGGNNYAALDTAAVVYLRSGQLEKARDAMRRALAVLRDGDYAANEVKLNAAEVFLRSGDYATALRQVEDVRKDRGRSGLVENRARELLLAIEQGKRRR